MHSKTAQKLDSILLMRSTRRMQGGFAAQQLDSSMLVRSRWKKKKKKKKKHTTMPVSAPLVDMVRSHMACPVVTLV